MSHPICACVAAKIKIWNTGLKGCHEYALQITLLKATETKQPSPVSSPFSSCQKNIWHFVFQSISSPCRKCVRYLPALHDVLYLVRLACLKNETPCVLSCSQLDYSKTFCTFVNIKKDLFYSHSHNLSFKEVFKKRVRNS